MHDLITELHTAAFAHLGESKVSENQLNALTDGFTGKVEFLHPRYGLRVWLRNKEILAGAEDITDEQREKLESFLTSAYPLLTRTLERKYKKKDYRFDQNKAPHRAFSVLRDGKLGPCYKGTMKLEHLIDGKDYGVSSSFFFCCVLSTCLVPKESEHLADQSFFIRYLLRARSIHLLSSELLLMGKENEKMATVEVKDILQGWGPYAAPPTGIWKAFVEDNSKWAPMQYFNEENLNKLFVDRTKWKVYSDTMKDEGYGLAWLKGRLS